LKEILEKEGINFDQQAVKELAKKSGGDMRAALLDAQSLATKKITSETVEDIGLREREQNIFSTLAGIFRAKSINDARQAMMQADIDPELLAKWIEENLPREFENKEELAEAFEIMSKADLYEGRIINRQYFGLKRYSSDLIAAISVVGQGSKRHWVAYQFPEIVKKLSKSISERNIKESLAEKIAAKTHASKREIIKELEFWKAIFSNKELAIALAAYFDLEENELEFLLEKGSKVDEILEKAAKIKPTIAKIARGKQKTLFG
ncbi:MAG: hypothetical protein J7L14_02405, partial [Candidatus Diapherotrites archaeon]|nr:hypothetical protein [Candidatus Diapherotrites archaeon]